MHLNTGMSVGLTLFKLFVFQVTTPFLAFPINSIGKSTKNQDFYPLYKNKNKIFIGGLKTTFQEFLIDSDTSYIPASDQPLEVHPDATEVANGRPLIPH